MSQQFRGGRPNFARRPPPLKHDHVGHMTFADRRASCSGCGQRWWLQIDTDQFGKTKTRWVYLAPDEDWPFVL